MKSTNNTDKMSLKAAYNKRQEIELARMTVAEIQQNKRKELRAYEKLEMQLQKFEEDEDNDQVELEKLMLANSSQSNCDDQIRIDDPYNKSMNSDDELEAKMKEIEEKIANNQYALKDDESEPSVKIEDIPQPKDENDLFFATEIDTHYQPEVPAPLKNKSVLTKTIDESMTMNLQMEQSILQKKTSHNKLVSK